MIQLYDADEGVEIEFNGSSYSYSTLRKEPKRYPEFQFLTGYKEEEMMSQKRPMPKPISQEPIETTNLNGSGSKTIFISYSTKNIDQANAVKARLEAEGYNVIIDHEFFLMGERFEDEIDKAISKSDATLFLISEESLSSSWVGMENVVGKVLQEITDRPLLSAFLEKDFLETRFVINLIKKTIKPKLAELEETIKEQLEFGIGIENLKEDHSRQKRLMANLPQIVGFMRERNCINISGNGDVFNTQMDNLVGQLKRVL